MFKFNNIKYLIKKTTAKYVTMSAFEKAMSSIAKSFSRMEERFTQHDKAFELLFKQMQVYTEEAREHRQTMSSLIHTDVKQERDVEDLKIRVEKLESKI